MACYGRFSKEWLRRRLHLKEKDQKTIWIRAPIRSKDKKSGKRALEYAWYKLNPEDPTLTSGSPVPRLPLPPMLPGILEYSGFAISSSRIYVVGGKWDLLRRCDESADVYILDVNGTGSSTRSTSSSSGWIAGPPMLCPRIRPTCIVVDDKVYVFGGERREDRPFGEFFDPTTSRWKALLPRIPIPRNTDFSITGATVLDGKRYILVHFDHTPKLMGLCIEDLSWVCVDRKFDPWCAYMVEVDDVIYSVVEDPWNGFPIAAYHMTTGKSLFVHNNIKTEDLPRLIHIGSNKFWLFSGGSIKCHFVKIKVRKNFREKTLESISITSLSSGHFSLDGFDDIVVSI